MSRASKWTRALTTRALWEAIRISAMNNEEGRPLGLRPRDICLPNPIAPTRLRLYDYLADLDDPSCVHSRDSYRSWRNRPRSQSRDPLVPLVNDAISVLKQLEVNSLDSFRYVRPMQSENSLLDVNLWQSRLTFLFKLAHGHVPTG